MVYSSDDGDVLALSYDNWRYNNWKGRLHGTTGSGDPADTGRTVRGVISTRRCQTRSRIDLEALVETKCKYSRWVLLSKNAGFDIAVQ
jgi:hypothetical protein